MTQEESTDPNANFYDIIAEPPNEKPIENCSKGEIMLPPGNTNLNRALPKLSPGELNRKPNENNYVYVYGHMVAGSGGVVDGAPGSGNHDVMYAEIDDSGVDEDTEYVGSDLKSEGVTYSEINETCDTMGTLETKNSGEDPGDTVGNTVEKPGDILEDSDMTMIENDLYSTN